MKLNLASLIQFVARRDAAAVKRVAVQPPADPFDRLARIVKVERAREAAVMRMQAHHHAG